eukprot:2155071-Prymnesium_polylepis.1
MPAWCRQGMIDLPPAPGPLTAAMGATVQLLLAAQGKTYVLCVAADADAERLAKAASARTSIPTECLLLYCGGKPLCMGFRVETDMLIELKARGRGGGCAGSKPAEVRVDQPEAEPPVTEQAITLQMKDEFAVGPQAAKPETAEQAAGTMAAQMVVQASVEKQEAAAAEKAAVAKAAAVEKAATATENVPVDKAVAEADKEAAKWPRLES